MLDPGTVLVTGAAGAIGAALCRSFAARWPAAHLALVDVDEAGLRRTAAELPDASVHRWDLSDPEGLEARWRELGHEVDVLVNCAGLMDVRSVIGMPWAAGRRVLDIDLVAPMRLMSLAAPAMVRTSSRRTP